MSVPFAELLDLRAPFRLRTEAFGPSQADICTMGAGRARMRGDADTHANLLSERPIIPPSLPSLPSEMAEKDSDGCPMGQRTASGAPRCRDPLRTPCKQLGSLDLMLN